MQALVTKDNVTISQEDKVHEGEYNVNHINFSFSEEYTNDLVKNAVFAMGDKIYQTSIINNQCNIPSEILSDVGEVFFGVYAYKVNDGQLELRYSPFPTRFTIISRSYNPTAEESQEITPSQFEQYMQALNDGLNKVEESLKEMDEATSSTNDLVDEINQKLENGDFIGPEGPQGIQGDPGTNGKDGVGITTITSGQSTVEKDKTITPVTVQKTDGSSQIFNVEAKNGIDGQNGQDGLTPTIGENGNWYLGDTDTGKPSRGETGSTPDLSDYVKNTDYATVDKTGVIKARNFFRVSTTGDTYVESIGKEMYKSAGDTSFISKGTLENIKNDYVGSSTPVQDLTSTVTNIQEEQDESKPKNTASGEMITVDDAIKHKVFNVTVDGASEQHTTTGKNLLPYPYTETTLTRNGITYTVNDNGSVLLNGTATSDTSLTLFGDTAETSTYDIPGDYVSGGTSDAHVRVVARLNGEYHLIADNTSGFTKIDKSVYTKGYVEIKITAGKTFNNVTIYSMLSNEQNIEYEPYTGEQPSPSPDYPQPITTLTFDKITRCGKNLASKNYIGMNDSITFNTSFKSGEKITMVLKMPEKAENNNNQGINIYDSSDTLLFSNRYTNWSMPESGWVSFVFSIVNDTNLLRLNAYGFQNNIEIPTAVLKGSLVEEGKYIQNGDLYEPYQGQTYDIDLQGNEMVEIPNGVKDELVIDKYGNVSLVKNVGKVVLDGSEDDWNMIVENEKYRFSTDVIQNLVKPSTTCLSNYFISGSNSDGDYFVENTIEIAPSGGITICTYVVSNSVEELKTWLQEHDVTVYYQLANPKTIPLGTLSELITTLNGTNNISINGNIPTTISTTYALDIKKYIDNKLAEISTAMIEEG